MTRAEALKKVRQMSLPKETMEILEALAPELAESEDERIRKELVAFFKGMQDSDWHEKYWHDLEIDRILAYLEKQKEQKPAEWSEEDERKLQKCIKIVEIWEGDYDIAYAPYSSMLKSLRPSWKPSEEHLSALLAVFNDPNNIGSQTCQLALTDLYEQLKKL